MNFNSQLESRVNEIEEIIKKYLPEGEGRQAKVIEAMHYSVLGGGKRLRPMLMLESFRLFNGENQEALEPFIAAIEMIHNYSLVHDDLPSMDNDELRRGRQTTHIRYGEDIAILAGDALLNLAFEIAGKSFETISGRDKEKLLQYERIAKSFKILGGKSGIYGMIGGQAVDIDDKVDNDLDRLNFINKLKTSALIEASMMIGATVAGAREEEINLMEQIASKLGLAFQIKDDILDITSTEEELGKPIKSDAKNEKKTYVDLMGLDGAEEMVVRYSNQAVEIYESLGYSNEYLLALMIKLINREK